MIEFIFKTSTLLKKALWRRCFPVNFTIIVLPSDCLCESNHEQMSILPPFQPGTPTTFTLTMKLLSFTFL